MFVLKKNPKKQNLPVSGGLAALALATPLFRRSLFLEMGGVGE